MAPPERGSAALSLVEAALEAWAECEPDGYLLPERRALSLLLTLGAHLPGDEGNLGARARRLEALVPVCSGDGGSPGALDLAAKDGQVHLLYFWRAYTEVARLVAAPDRSGAEGVERAPAPPQGSVAELERLRDAALELLEASKGKSITAWALAEALQHVAKDSAVPAFWKKVAESMGPDSKVRELGMEELTVLLLSWLHDAVMWQEAPGQTLKSDMLPAFGPVDDSEQCSMITVASWNPAVGTLLPSSVSSLYLKSLSRPPSHQTTLRPAAAQSQAQRTTGCQLPAPGALLLDMEEQMRASGSLCLPERARPYARSAMFAATPAGTALGSPRSELMTTLLPEPPSEAPLWISEASEPPSPVSAPGNPMMPADTSREELMPSLEVLSGCEGLPVSLHIYDVSQEASIRRLNAILANRKSPIKLGGVFHAAVEVDGIEWSYGRTSCQHSTGVARSDPRCDPNHHFRETVNLPPALLTKEQVGQLVAELQQEYLGRDYNLLRRNCCHFADDFCQRLGVGRIPAWVYRLARIGARIDSVLRPMQGLRRSVTSTPTPPPSISPSATSCGRSQRQEEAPLLT